MGVLDMGVSFGWEVLAMGEVHHGGSIWGRGVSLMGGGPSQGSPMGGDPMGGVGWGGVS